MLSVISVCHCALSSTSVCHCKRSEAIAMAAFRESDVDENSLGKRTLGKSA